jgi:hypothetical protein
LAQSHACIPCMICLSCAQAEGLDLPPLAADTLDAAQYTCRVVLKKMKLGLAHGEEVFSGGPHDKPPNAGGGDDERGGAANDKKGAGNGGGKAAADSCPGRGSGGNKNCRSSGADREPRQERGGCSGGPAAIGGARASAVSTQRALPVELWDDWGPAGCTRGQEKEEEEEEEGGAGSAEEGSEETTFQSPSRPGRRAMRALLPGATDMQAD